MGDATPTVKRLAHATVGTAEAGGLAEAFALVLAALDSEAWPSMGASEKKTSESAKKEGL